jgi:8-oxo-dGTP pyrophosphatase MutT (NUDIX family)
VTDETRDPWTRRSRFTAYENPWIVVWHDRVVHPDGSDGIYGVVHFRTRAVGVVLLDDADRVLLVGQFRYPLGRYSWEIPEGGSPRGEDPRDGIVRELEEETGFTAASWRELTRFTLSNSITDEEGVIFVAREPVPGPASPEPSEELALRWVGFEEALEMVDRGEIHDVISQTALLALARERSAGATSSATEAGTTKAGPKAGPRRRDVRGA